MRIVDIIEGIVDFIYNYLVQHCAPSMLAFTSVCKLLLKANEL